MKHWFVILTISALKDCARVCSYEIEYANEAETKGYLANELFTFQQSNSNVQTEKFQMIFGCGTRNKDSIVVDPVDDLISGIFGLDKHLECNTLIPNVDLINNVNKFKQKGCYTYSLIIHSNNK